MWAAFIRRFRRRKKEPPPRRKIIEEVQEVLSSTEATERITNAVKTHPPGTSMRWEKILPIINTNQEPTEEIPDPLRVNITKEVLMDVLREMYERVRSIQSDGLALAREFIPLMYDKHSVERAMNVSQRERDQKGMTDECYAYGELDHEIFAAMYIRLTSVFGERSRGTFYDLGCGVGTLVYAAAFIGDFDRVIGIENVASLLERGEKRAGRWERFQGNYTEKIRNVQFDWIEDDFMLNGFWTTGTYVISFTNPIPGEDFVILVHDTCVTSWGKSDFFFQEKVTAAKKRRV